MNGNRADLLPILIVPACEKGMGGGHLNRCLFLLRALEEKGRETYLWISEQHKDDVFKRFRNLFENSYFSKSMNVPGSISGGFYARLLSGREDLEGRSWEYIILDNYKTSEKDFEFWSGLARIIGIDEGGPCRKYFDFLIDLLPAIQIRRLTWTLPVCSLCRPGGVP